MGKKATNTLFIMGFIFYSLFILWVILFKYVSPFELFDENRYFSRSMNIIPFNDILNGRFNKLDLFGNVILFIPLGIYINIMIKNIKFSKCIGRIVATSLAFECIQYIFGLGASDLTDIIINTVGGIMGIGIYKLIKKGFKEHNKVKNFIAICSTVVMIPVITVIIGIIVAN